MDVKKLVAHRGDNTNYPENSYSGIESALKTGAHYIEFDIQMNKDGSFLVIHDADFNRTAGVDLSVFDVSDTEVSPISVHHPENFKKKSEEKSKKESKELHYPTPVPFLSDIMNLFKQYPKAKALVEIKNESIERWGLEKIMTTLLHDLKDFVTQAIVIGYSDAALEYTQKHSEHQTGLVFNRYDKDIQETANKLKPDYMICPYDIIPKDPLKEKVWQGRWQWMVYSINDKTVAQQALDRSDVDFIETDDIRLMLGK
jgi:glycerophosphoryl diester phosphodiesterase